MLTKQINRNFSSILDEELMRVNGGKMGVRRGLLEIVDVLDKIDMEEVGRKLNKVRHRIVILGRELANNN